MNSLVGIMSFASYVYLAWLALAVIVFFSLPGSKTRALWLLLTSCIFFALFSPQWLWIIAIITISTYCFGFFLEGTRSDADSSESPEAKDYYEKKPVWVLWLCVVSVVAALLFFKYAASFTSILTTASGALGGTWKSPTFRLVMPVGISFWTFQLVAYSVDVYKGKTKKITNFLYFATSVIFFPIVTMGPITRVNEIVPQLTKKYRFDYERMQSGVLLIGWGMFKKLLIADRLAVFVESVFADPRAFSRSDNGLIFLVAAVFFALQLYADFSGYTDIVRGSARLFGVELPLNFSAPYFARNVADFWRRWHMTLMDWLKCYIYIPLGGNRKGKTRKYVNLLATFAVSGLWHGVGLTYLVWGLLNGCYQIGGQLLAPFNRKMLANFHIERDSSLHHALQTLLTFLLITIAWVFFRAKTIGDALFMLSGMFIPTFRIFSSGIILKQGLPLSDLLVGFLGVVVLFVVDYLRVEKKFDAYSWLKTRPLPLRWTIYLALIVTIVVFGYYGGTFDASNFVYNQF